MPQKNPTCALIRLVVCTYFLLFFSSATNFMGINFQQGPLERFINQSAQDVFSVDPLDVTHVKLSYGVVASLPMATAVPGGMLGRCIADRWGRKRAIFYVGSAIQFCACIATGLSYYIDNLVLFYIGRALFGVYFGIIMVVAQIFVSECTPPAHRGSIGNVGTVVICSVAVVVYALSLPQVFGGEKSWPLLYLVMIPVVLGAFTLGCFVPETPKYDYLQRHDREAAVASILKYYGKETNVQSVLRNLEHEKNQAQNKVGFKDVWRSAHLRKAMYISNAIASTRVTSGVLLLAIFTQGILKTDLELSAETANYIVIGTAALATFGAIGGTVLVNKYGRRPLFLSTSIIMLIFIVAFIGLSVGVDHGQDWMRYPGLLCIMGTLVTFQVAPSTIQIYYPVEIVPQTARATISFISTSLTMILRVTYFTIFPYMQANLGSWSLAILAVVPTIPTLIYLHRVMPETKNRAIADIVTDLLSKSRSSVGGCESDTAANLEKEEDTTIPSIDASNTTIRRSSDVGVNMPQETKALLTSDSIKKPKEIKGKNNAFNALPSNTLYNEQRSVEQEWLQGALNGRNSLGSGEAETGQQSKG